MQDETRTSACACGKVTISLSGPPARSMLCACADCRRLTGSAFNWSAYWPEADVRRSGETRSFRRGTASGRGFTYAFCPDCGTTMWWQADFADGMIGTGAGALDGPPMPRPERAYWTQGRAAWVPQIDEIPTMDRQ